VRPAYAQKVASLPSSIDQFVSLQGVVSVSGWSSHFARTQTLSLFCHGEPLPITVQPTLRADVAEVHGGGAEHWGFRACGLLPSPETDPAAVTLVFGDGHEFGTLYDKGSAAPDNPHVLFSEFVNEINARGGTVLEIGARARSGNESRGRFGPNVRYIGVDIVAGENVDVVADAHALSDAIREPVDFVFSISTFEHLLMPWKAALEINKVLKPGGRVFTHSHQAWPVHDEPWDFYRFSREGWTGLFNAHTGFRMIEARRGDRLAVTPYFNTGGPYAFMANSPAWGMSVCLAEKTGEPLVSWNRPVSELLATYGH
jgi:SAM-dependent methyltransferase